MGLRILMTNNTLGNRAGTELYLRDIAAGLLDRGHLPAAYSTKLGAVAGELRNLGIPVTDDLGTLKPPPDIIHGQHHLDTVSALLQFPQTPALFVCHGISPWEEMPPRLSRIRRYIAVDEACRERLIVSNAIPAGSVELLLNFVDLERFRRRGPLPAKPERALVFSNNIDRTNLLPEFRRACRKAGIRLDVAGLASGRPVAAPEEILDQYDIVFAKGRSAIEAMASGCAVVACDLAGLGSMVTSGNFAHFRSLNFGARTFTREVNAKNLAGEIEKYSPTEAEAVTHRIRETAGLGEAVTRYIEIYREIIAEHSAAGGTDPNAEIREISAYLQRITPDIKEFLAGWRERQAVLERRKGSSLHRIRQLLRQAGLWPGQP